METKSNFNLEKTKTTHFLIGFCFISSIVLATLSYGELEPIENIIRRTSLDNNQLLISEDDKPKEIEQLPQVRSQVIQPTQKETSLDLNSELKTTEITNVFTETKSVDLGLPKGDTTVLNVNNDLPLIQPNKVEDFPDVEAQFPGGYDSWKKYLLNEIKYPEVSIDMDEQGVVYLSFVVDTDGTITDIRVIKSVSFDIDKEAKRVIKNSPKWDPARIKNQPVKSRMSIPIKFTIN